MKNVAVVDMVVVAEPAVLVVVPDNLVSPASVAAEEQAVQAGPLLVGRVAAGDQVSGDPTGADEDTDSDSTFAGENESWQLPAP